MRVLISKESRINLVETLKSKNHAGSLKDLSVLMGISFKTLNKWIYGKGYIPQEIIPPELFHRIKIIDRKEDNWGQIKGGEIGGKKSIKQLIKKLGLPKYKKIQSEAGKKVMNSLWNKYGMELKKMAVRGKIKKREEQSKKLEEENQNYFSNEPISWNNKNILRSKKDESKKIIFPEKMSPELAEEIGIHLGDGCMSFNRNYFSVKTNKKEEKYVTEFLFPLYKRLYNLDLKLMRLKSVSGFEVYSKALCEFKNKVIGLPYGEKVHKIVVPEVILKTKNKEIYSRFIRGLFDTDGCVCIVKKNYPVISITINSEDLIKKTSDMLKLMGFIPHYNKKSIYLNGKVMLYKWIREINSSNPVKIEKLDWASSITG
jgi:hypothetical protein